MRLPVLVLLAILTLHPALGYSTESLQINTSIKPPFSTVEKNGFFDLLLDELFSRIGIQAELIRLPAERALQMVNAGLSDAEVPRISGLNSKYPNLIEVEEPIIDYHFVAFSHKRDVPLDLCWENLAGKKVGHIIGWKIYEKSVPQSARITRVTSPTHLFKLLESKRIDIALYERYAGWHLIKANSYTDLEECRSPLAIRPMHLYLHKKHNELVDDVSRELQKMKNDGTWQDIFSKTLGKALEPETLIHPE